MEHSPSIEKDRIPCANAFDNQAALHDFVINAKRRFTVTKAYAKKYEEVFGVDFEYCPNVLSKDFFGVRDERKQSRNTEKFQFINVGILDPRKNQELLIRAFAKAFRGQSDVVLKIVGDGRLGPDLKKLATELNVVDQVEILGFLRPDAIRVLLDSSHAFVLSSTFETFGVVLIEAMARGLPVISSDIEGPSELIHAANGMLFKNGSVDDLSLKLVEMLNGYSQYDRERIIRETFKSFGSKAFMEHLSVSDLNQ
jgi:glycosyltransferase involved in cell wall biosynthesis